MSNTPRPLPALAAKKTLLLLLLLLLLPPTAAQPEPLPAFCELQPAALGPFALVITCDCADDPTLPPLTAWPTRSLHASVTLLTINNCRLPRLTTDSIHAQPLPDLTNLSVQGNGITRIDADFFAALPSLSVLNLASNALTELPSNIFHNSPDLAVVVLRSNRLTQLPAFFLGLPSASFFDIGRNNLTYIHPDFCVIPATNQPAPVTNLALDFIPLPAIPLLNLPRLRLLDLGHTLISRLPESFFAYLPALETLQLDTCREAHCTILEVTTSLLDDLLGFNLAALSLSSQVNFAPVFLGSLTDPYTIKLATILAHFKDVGSLTASVGLEVPYLNLGRVPWPIFTSPGIPELDVSNNHLTEIHVGSVQGLKSLTLFDALDNPVVRIGRGTFDRDLRLPSLATVRMHDDLPLVSGCLLHETETEMRCHCTAGLMGDGSFCETTCPETLLGSTCAERYHSGVCRPAGMASVFVCDDEVWRPVADACSACTCTAGQAVRNCAPGLEEIPVNIPSTTTVLDLSNTALARLRREFAWNLPKVHTLLLANTPLRSLPESGMRGLSALRVLHLAGAQIVNVSDSVYENHWGTLQELDLSGMLELQNPNLELAAYVPGLQRLYLARLPHLANYLHGLSAEFAGLTVLDLSDSALTAVPDWVRRIPTLVSLNLSGNKLTALAAADFEGLKSLRTL